MTTTSRKDIDAELATWLVVVWATQARDEDDPR